MKKCFDGIITFSLIILIWQLVASFGGWNNALLPDPHHVMVAFEEMLDDGSLRDGLRDSMIRFAIGYGTAVVAGTLLGLLLGWFAKLWQFFNPLVQLMRPISPMAWLPFIVLLFGIGDLPAIMIIFISAFFPILIATVSAVNKIDVTYLKVAKNFGIRQPFVLTNIVFPACFPQIATSLHLALGTAWIFLVSGEMVGAQTGLGYLIIDARNNMRADILMADIIVIGLVGLALDACIGLFEKKISRIWGFTKG